MYTLSGELELTSEMFLNELPSSPAGSALGDVCSAAGWGSLVLRGPVVGETSVHGLACLLVVRTISVLNKLGKSYQEI